MDTASDGFFADVDTPEDYHNLTEVRNAAYHGEAVKTSGQFSQKNNTS